MFPPVIVVTAKRPVVTIYSTSEKRCVVIELTVRAEENLGQANNRKKCKYADLIHECQEAGWDVRYFPVEVGSRGFTNQTLRACFKYLDLSNKEIRLAIDEISKTALRAYTIWLVLSHYMSVSWELVERPVVPTVRQLECEGPRGHSAITHRRPSQVGGSCKVWKYGLTGKLKILGLLYNPFNLCISNKVVEAEQARTRF